MYAEILEKELQTGEFPYINIEKKGIYRKPPIYMKYDKRT